ncbi:hypothetical protein FUAX_39910 (plasmid) [Fulvitalea axinellae]|uniref:MacB-like periplasmic core domain-containing protein n=1 Tax=Fulvitalea axinellae TaxID=1182444 RepID=A0AAU9CYH6_9BACT|nr:hypothetical protein FUAX_39910 [Fulvitalea axinellae]
MLFYYLKISIRRLLRDKVYATVNILGLALALSVCTILFNYAYKEWKTDRQYENAENIYWLLRDYETAVSELSPYHRRFIADSLLARHPEIVRVGRARVASLRLVEDSVGIDAFEKYVAADRSFFEMFGFSLLQGTLSEFEDDARKAVISKSYAEKVYGNQSPLGMELPLVSFDKHRYTVVAVMEDIPEWSSVKTDIILTDSKKRSSGLLLELLPGYRIEHVLASIPKIKASVRRGDVRLKDQKWRSYSLKGLYMEAPHVSNGIFQRGNGFYFRGILFAGCLAVVLSLLNYNVLSVSGNKRYRLGTEVRGALGESGTEQGLFYFVETLLHLFIATVFSVVLTYSSYPLINRFVGFSEVEGFYLVDGFPFLWALLLLFCLAVMFASKLVYSNRVKLGFMRRQVEYVQTVGQVVIFCLLLICAMLYRACS